MDDAEQGCPWKVFVLRDMMVTYRGTELGPVTAARQRELLAWLAIHPGVHHRTRVSGQIWPDESIADARLRLRQTLKGLLDALGPDFGDLLVRTRNQLGLRASPNLWIDITAMEERVEAGGVEAALELSEGELMPEISNEWIDVCRIDHQSTTMRLVEQTATHAELGGDLAGACRLTDRWVELEPGAEVPRKELIRRHIDNEDAASASAAANSLLTLLRDQGLQPSPATQEVLARLNGDRSDGAASQRCSRDAMLVQLGSSDLRSALQAAKALALDSLRRGETCCLPLEVDLDLEGGDPGITVRAAVGAGAEYKLTLTVARDLLPDRDGFLLWCLCSLFKLGTPDTCTDASEILASVGELPPRVTRADAEAVTTDRTGDVVGHLCAGADVALIGPSAAGKSVTAAQIALRLVESGWSCGWFDLSEPSTSAVDLLASLASSDGGPAGSHLIVIDDLHANPGLAVQFGDLLKAVRSSLATRSRVLMLGWDSARELAGEVCRDAITVPCSGEDLLGQIIAGLVDGELPESVLGQIRQVSSGDLLVAREAISHFLRVGQIPSLREVAARSFHELIEGEPLSTDAILLAYRLSALGQFEIDASRSFAEAQSRAGLEELVARRIVRPVGNFVSVGHRSHAALIAMHLQAEHAETVAYLPSPAKISLDYLRAAGDRQIVAMLQRLDLATAALDDADQHGSTYLARAWESIQILGNYLRRQVQGDATWGDNVASAINAAHAFSRFDEDAWETTAAYVRTRWQIEVDSLPHPRGGPSCERDDFSAIAIAMKQEDETREAEGLPVGMPSDAIDFDRMHRTWILGQMLGFEATAPTRDVKRLEDLAGAAAKVQEPEGNFYPARVPWVTARVVLGLAAAGHTAGSSTTVRQACDWLRRPSPDGPYQAGAWMGGTGPWNTTTETTAMCLAALVRAGIPVDDKIARTGRAYLLAQRAEWVQPGAEIDAANVLEIFLLTGGRWREMSAELTQLLAWARDTEPWRQTAYLASESQAQSSKVAHIANSMVGILWATVKTELPILLEGVANVGEGR